MRFGSEKTTQKTTLFNQPTTKVYLLSKLYATNPLESPTQPEWIDLVPGAFSKPHSLHIFYVFLIEFSHISRNSRLYGGIFNELGDSSSITKR